MVSIVLALSYSVMRGAERLSHVQCGRSKRSMLLCRPLGSGGVLQCRQDMWHQSIGGYGIAPGRGMGIVRQQVQLRHLGFRAEQVRP